MTWLNSKPLTMKQLRGKVVLLDFWTYSCVNCIRTQPHLNKWHKQYAKKGLVIIGVHAPEFDFEKLVENVEQAVDEFDIYYPVVLDPDYEIWNAYQNHWWPRKLLINKSGTIVFDHIGEGDYAETEEAIQDALRKAGAKRLPKVTSPAGGTGAVCHPTTPELYLGFKRGSFANKTIEKGHVHVYRPSAKKTDLPLLEGSWRVAADHVESHGGKLYVPYMAGSVNIVAEVTEKVAMTVTRDGKAIEHTEAGDDVSFEGRRSVVLVDEPRMYRLVLSAKHHEAVLELDVPAGVRLYSLTFGGECD